MPARPARLFHHLRRIVSRRVPDPASDAALLERYVSQRDQAAFAALVDRHGPMIMRLCRRVLADGQAAEDAFQATFLVLARRAAAVYPQDTVAAWLYGVAYRVALKIRTANNRRRLREGPSAELTPADPRQDPLAELTARELLSLLDEEVRRLPSVFRLPVILCCLEGRTQEEAARQLGWTPGSLKGRLERGRRRLHLRLTQRGVTLVAALALVEVSRGAAPAVSAALAEATLAGASAWAAAASLANAGVSAHVQMLVQEASKGASALKLKVVAVLALVIGIVAAAGVVARLGSQASVPPAAEPDMPRSEKGALLPRLRDTLGGGHTWYGTKSLTARTARPWLLRRT